jgi:hypothetical protein
MNTRRRFDSRLRSISFLLFVSAAVLLGQSQPQVPAQTKPEIKTETQPEIKAATQAQTKAGTQAVTKAGTHAAIGEGTQTNIKQPTQQAQDSTRRKIGNTEKQTSKARSYSRRCQAITSDGTRCTLKALPGSKYCRLHGGK